MEQITALVEVATRLRKERLEEEDETIREIQLGQLRWLSKRYHDHVRRLPIGTEVPVLGGGVLRKASDNELTSDGRIASRTNWCRCAEEVDPQDLIRYVSLDGTGHGYACPSCRGIVQTG